MVPARLDELAQILHYLKRWHHCHEQSHPESVSVVETAFVNELKLPSPCVVVLVGPGASGKSTWAAEHFGPELIVSSDRLHALVGAGEDDLAASADAFALLDVVAAADRTRADDRDRHVGVGQGATAGVASGRAYGGDGVCGGRTRGTTTYYGRQIPQVGRAWEDFLESWTTLRYLAACTNRVRLGTLISGITYRNVAHLGKIAATLDVLSGGRDQATNRSTARCSRYPTPPVIQGRCRTISLCWWVGAGRVLAGREFPAGRVDAPVHHVGRQGSSRRRATGAGVAAAERQPGDVRGGRQRRHRRRPDQAVPRAVRGGRGRSDDQPARPRNTRLGGRGDLSLSDVAPA
nr:LLM class flavin-dependent oxidoreductase [Kribbella solani]